MNPIQLILIPILLLLIVFYIRNIRQYFLLRLLAVFVFIAGIIFVALPELTTKIAQSLGVGRGADLLLYVTVLAFYMAIIYFYSKIQSLEKKLATLTRAVALGELGQEEDRMPN